MQFGVDYFPRSRGVSTLSSNAVIIQLVRECSSCAASSSRSRRSRSSCADRPSHRSREPARPEGRRGRPRAAADRLLIVNADDYGLTDKVSRAILRAHRNGIVTSTSVLTLAPAFDTSVRWLLDERRLGTGAHLAVVGEDPPLLSAAEIPTLVDGKGRLRPSWQQFLPRAAAGRIDPDDLRREFSAQIERILAAGLTIDHLDTHQNLHLWPMVRDVVLDVGETFDIKVIRVDAVERADTGRAHRAHARPPPRAQLRRRGWRSARASTGLDEAGRLDLPSMIKALHRLAASPGPVGRAGHPSRASPVTRIGRATAGATSGTPSSPP